MKLILAGILSLVVGSQGQWIRVISGKNCQETCEMRGLGCNQAMLNSVRSCSAITSAFASVGVTCQSDCVDADYPAGDGYKGGIGPPWYNQHIKRCQFLGSGENASCGNRAPAWIQLCYCMVTPKPTPAPTEVVTTVAPDHCSVFDIDGFLTECSTEFPAVKTEIDGVSNAMKDEIAQIEAAINATNDAMDALEAKMVGEIARIDDENDATNNNISELEEKMGEEVTRIDTALSGTSDTVTALSSKVETEVARLDGLIDDIEHTLDVMANLRVYKSAGLGDYIQLEDGDDVNHDGYVKVSMGMVKLFAVFAIISFICLPVMMVWMSLRYFNRNKTAKVAYSKVDIISETEAEDNPLMRGNK